jgi:hypothetical protein
VARPDEFPVRPTVEVAQATATDDHPPQFRTTLTNVTDGSVTVGESRSAHFEYVSDESRTSLLLPHRPDEQYPTDRGCWRLTGEFRASADFWTHERPPGESTTRLVDCYGLEGDEGTCLPTGTYRFTTSMALFSETRADRSRSARWEFEMRFV